MSGDITIREVTPRDVEALAAIARAAWTPVYEARRRLMGDAIFKTVHPDWAEAKAEQVRRACVPASGTHVRVVELDGEVAGFVTFRLDVKPGVGEIGNNAVDPRFQGRGIGSRMYAHVLDEMRRMGMRYACVSTGGDDAHIGARRAYEKAGFERPIPSVTYYRKL